MKIAVHISWVLPSLSSIPLEHFLPRAPLFSPSKGMALQGPLPGFCENMTSGLLLGRSIYLGVFKIKILCLSPFK